MIPIQWRPMYDDAGTMQVGIWDLGDGYTARELRSPVITFGVHRPGEAEPFAYTPVRFEVAALVDADQRAMA